MFVGLVGWRLGWCVWFCWLLCWWLFVGVCGFIGLVCILGLGLGCWMNRCLVSLVLVCVVGVVWFGGCVVCLVSCLVWGIDWCVFGWLVCGIVGSG